MQEPQFIQIIKNEFEKKKNVNSRYSLRSFSKYLGLDPGSLSAILRGKRSLSPIRARQIVDRLKIKDDEKKTFFLSLLRQRGIPWGLVEERNGFQVEEEQYFRILVEWEYAAALCLLTLKAFDFDAVNLSRALNISKKRASLIISNLEKDGLICLKDNKATLIHKNFSTTEDIQSAALQCFHQANLSVAKKKLNELGVIERDFSSIVIAANSRQLGEMKEMIRNFRRQFEAKFESESGDVIMNLNLQLYPISNKITDLSVSSTKEMLQ